jgi:hypothetical protein
MHELLEVVADAVERAGGDVSVHVGPYPVMQSPCAYVVIPHEYFVVTPREHLPNPEQRAHTIGFCVEHAGNQTFEVSVAHARLLGGAMDINADSVVEMRRRGIPVERFTLGYSPLWDVWNGGNDSARPLDITYLGTTDVRRRQLLALQAEELSVWETRLLTPPHEPMYRPRVDFLMGKAKLRHLASSKVLINLHRGGSRALEWVRVLEAMCNGCVVVSERSDDFDPLVPGEHVLFADPKRIVATASAVLREPERLEAIRTSAWAQCRTMDMRTSAVRLMEMADDVVSRDRPALTRQPMTTPGDARSFPMVPEPPQPASDLPSLASWATALPESFRRLQASLLSAAGPHPASVAITEALQSRDGTARAVALVPNLVGDARQVARTVACLASQNIPLAGWTGRPGALATAPPGGFGIGATLNALVRATESELVLIVEPGQALFANAVERLLGALEAAPEAIAGFGFMADPSAGELWNALPLEVERLARRVYLSAPLLIRRSALVGLGGFSEDPALGGYEYHELWCRIARRGYAAVFVQQILGRGTRPRPAGSAIADIAPEVTLEALQRMAPRTLASSSHAGTA